MPGAGSEEEASSDTEASAKSPKRSCRRVCLVSWCSVAAVLSLGAGVLAPLLLESGVRQQLRQQLAISNASATFAAWLRPPCCLRFSLWLWNVTNAEEVVAGARPSLRQVGPFVFKEQRFKEAVRFFDNDTVAFVQRRRFFYSRRLSGGLELDDVLLTSVNLAYASAVQRLRHQSPAVRALAHRYLLAHSGRLFVTRSARRLLLGQEDKALKLLSGAARWLAPGLRLRTRVGLFVDANETDSGRLLVDTGRRDSRRLGRVVRWNGRRRTAAGAEVAGTDGSRFAPGAASPTSRLRVFSPEVCRSVGFRFRRRSAVHSVPTLRFVPAAPADAADGVLNVSACLGGAPLFLTSPHFDGSPAAAADVEGVDANSRFSTVLDVEPTTGFVLRATRLTQLNVHLTAVAGFEETRRLRRRRLLLPLMWLNETGGVSADDAAELRRRLLLPLRLLAVGQWLLIGLGFCCLVVAAAVAAACGLRRRRRRRRCLRNTCDCSSCCCRRQRLRPTPPAEEAEEGFAMATAAV